MKRSVGNGLIVGMILLGVMALAVAQIYTVYSPVSNGNVPISRVSIDDITVWISSPEFRRWTNMDGLAEYLINQGTSLEELERKNAALTSREKLTITGRKRIVRSLTAAYADEDGNGAIRELECDLDKKEVKFELKNIGNYNWFLVDQRLTSGYGESSTKSLSDELVQAKPIKLFINNFPVNTLIGRYWMGEKLFFGHGESFADACRADFVRTGKTVKCELQPVPVRQAGVIPNSYVLLTPSFNERGHFICE